MRITRLSSKVKKYTRQQYEEILLQAIEYNEKGIDLPDALLKVFAKRENNDYKKAAKEVIYFLLQWANVPLYGTVKPATKRQHETMLLKEFLKKVPAGQRPTWIRFVKFCNANRHELPFQERTFQKRIKEI